MKCLVISHNPFSTFQNMGKTFLSLFSEFSSEEICQFYIYPSVPDTQKCNAYFRVTDKEILKSYFKLRAPGAKILPVTDRHELFEDPADEALYRSPKNQKPFRMLARDLMWRFSRWYSKQLRTFLDEEKPDCIMVAPGPYCFIYDVALRIAKKRNIPILSYICDDYYFVEKPAGLIARHRLRKLRRKIRQLMAHTSRIVTICEEMNEAYEKEFHRPTTTIMTGTSYGISDAPVLADAPDTITYMGNIRCERYQSLAQIGETLDAMNEADGTAYALHVYTDEKDPAILSRFEGIRSVKFCGFVTGETFLQTFRNSQLLLHTEAFDQQSIDLVKHSVSTKIADSLASGIPLLAYAPDAVSSMRHLLRHGCAITATSKEELPAMLRTAFTDAQARRAAATTALQVAHECHDLQKTGKDFYEAVNSLHQSPVH